MGRCCSQKACTNITLKTASGGGLLSALCNNYDGDRVSASMDLNQCIQNYLDDMDEPNDGGGQLTFPY
ncbi:hypothetical protein GOP47_0010161 [Adiantum capillus-veneris]|uniref:Cyanovirin-N domain-containing protein n=1 Tax=Adiantum capillus-veneris TaxID=13818 RepID=A0A9D4ZIG4_ADICA|nr:hypothetical protein GOP47_0010161 [Adiantum capillus-veneris]